MVTAGYIILLLLVLWVWRNRPRQYPALRSGSIRILELLPGQAGDDIVVRLHNAVLSPKSIAYEALSYTWDQPPIVTTRIKLNNRPLSITAGLGRTLRQLRYATKSRMLWIDQICIKQDDPAEVSAQMELMRDIYENASGTIIWLGEARDEDDLVTEIIQACKPLRRRIEELVDADIRSSRAYAKIETANIFAMHFSALVHADTRHLVSQQLDNPSKKTQQSLLAFPSRRWFVRLWPFQEVVVSKNKLSVKYGNHEVDWAEVGLLAAYLMHSDILNDVAGLERKGLEAANSVWFYWLHSQKEFPLLQMLRAGRKYAATKDSDKVFGVLGLSREVQQHKRQDAVMPLNLRIDTRLDTSIVYQRIAEYFLQRDGNLEILSQVQHVDILNPKLPSWVPDWSQPEIGTHLSIPGMIEEFCFDANPGSSHSSLPRSSGSVLQSTLTVSGVILGRIVRHMDCITQADVDAITAGIDGSAVKLLDWILAMSNFLAEAQMMVLTTGRMISRPIIRSRSKESSTILRDHCQQYCAFLRDLPRSLALKRLNGPSANRDLGEIWKLEARQKEARSEAEGLRRFTGIEGASADGSTMKEAILSACRDRRLVQLDSGKWCLGPSICITGDLICILDGARVPFVLRETDRGYQLVGECYVSDFMFGEVNRIRASLDSRRFNLY